MAVYKPNDRELVATLLDIRTPSCRHTSDADRTEARRFIRNLYIQNATPAYYYERKKKTAEVAAGAATAPAPAADDDALSIGHWGRLLEGR